jgi:hypothetical protein
MFSLTTAVTFAGASFLVDRLGLMQMPNSVLVGFCVQIAVVIGFTMIIQLLVQKRKRYMEEWSGLICYADDYCSQTIQILMLVLSNAVVKVSMWYAGSLWFDWLQLSLVMLAVQTIQYRKPAIFTMGEKESQYILPVTAS